MKLQENVVLWIIKRKKIAFEPRIYKHTLVIFILHLETNVNFLELKPILAIILYNYQLTNFFHVQQNFD